MKNNVIRLLFVVVLVVLVGVGIFLYKQYFGKKVVEPVSQGNSNLLNVQYRKKIILPDFGNGKELVNHQVFIKIDTMSLIQGNKLSFDCSNLYFTDFQGKKIPFWIEDSQCYSQDSIFWIKIPNLTPHEEKVIYVYYGNKSITSLSNYDAVFPQQNTEGLVAGYFLGPLVMGKDFSGHGNNGIKSPFFSTGFPALDDWGPAPTFNHWGCEDSWCESYNYKPNFTASTSKSVNYSEGTIEMWVNPYVVASENYQKIISDSNGSIELGIQPDGDLYFYPSESGGKNYNLIKNALTKEKWTHIVVTWNFKTKKTTFYINGKKRINDVENVSTFWIQEARVGDLWNIGGFAFAGELSGLRIYSKAMSEQEVTDAYINHNQAAIGPQLVLGEEELMSKSGSLSSPLYNSAKIEQIPTSDKIILTRHYSSPLEGDGIYGDSQERDNEGYKGFLYENTPVYLISKNDNKESVIFGVPSHIDAYSGTLIKTNDTLLLTHIGFKINDPTLIKNLYVQLGSGGVSDEMSYNSSNKNPLGFLIPVASACGGTNYTEIGGSELNFVEAQLGVYWYALKTPILTLNANTLQVSYVPNEKEGLLSIGLEDMIFQDENQKFVKVAQKASLSNRYYAYLAPEENGKIEFKQDSQSKKLVLLFENQGKDTFKIDEDSINSIESVFYSKILKINIRDNQGKILFSLSMQNIRDNILGKTINPMSNVSLPLPIDNLSNNTSYWITLEYKISRTDIPINQNRRKVIHWTLGNDAYYYPYLSKQWIGDSILSRLDIDSAGTMTFARPAN